MVSKEKSNGSKGMEKEGKPKWQSNFGVRLKTHPSLILESALAENFWSCQPPGMKEHMKKTIEYASSMGSIHLPTDGSVTLTNNDKEKVCAYRALAREMGYSIGKFIFDNKNNTMHATVNKI